MTLNIKDIICSSTHFSYKELLECMNVFSRKDIGIRTIGKSVLGKDLYLLKLGSGPYKIHINASTHANEWITTPIILNFLSDFYDSPYYEDLDSKITLDVVPMVNPDGVDLVCGRSPSNMNDSNKLFYLNNLSLDFSEWKSNINGVDLNRNFPAGFWKYKNIISCKNNTDFPSPKFYSGKSPLSEPESKALVKLCHDRDYDLVISLHTQGRVIYYTYNDMESNKSIKIANDLAYISGYELEEPEPDSSFAGFKDWFIQEFKRPGFTFELGKGVNPLNYQKFNYLYQEAYPLLLESLYSYEK